MQTTRRLPFAWIAIYGAIIGVTSYVPLIPYVTGGGFLPLSISLAAIAPLLLGFGPGILAALVGGLIGMFINPAAYPFGVLDAFFVGMAPAIFCGFAFKGPDRILRIIYVAILVLSGILAEIVPYYYPGSSGGFSDPPQPQYVLLVAFFFVPWLILYMLPIGTRYIHRWLNSEDPKYRLGGMLVGTTIGLLPWSLWMVVPVALTLNWPPELTIATWVFGGWSRAILSVIASVIAVPLTRALARSGLPVPPGAIWEPKR